MDTRKDEYLQILYEGWQNNDKFYNNCPVWRNLPYVNVMIPKSLSQIDLYLHFVSYYYSQVDKMAIFLSFLHQMIIF